MLSAIDEEVFGSVEEVGNGAASKNHLEEFHSIVQIEVYFFRLNAASGTGLPLKILKQGGKRKKICLNLKVYHLYVPLALFLHHFSLSLSTADLYLL